MKYHSLSWFAYALFYQFKQILRNTICRKILNIDFGYTDADLLTMFTEDNKYMIYKYLIHKYPELKRLEKYLKIERTFTLMEFVSASIFFKSLKRISVFWIYDAEIEDLHFLLKNEIGCIVHIKNALEQPHSIALLAYDTENGDLIFNDPLGDPFFKYKLFFGFNIKQKKDKFLKSCLGNPIRMSFSITSANTDQISKVQEYFSSKKLYSCIPEDFELYNVQNTDKVFISKFSRDGKLTIDLGDNAKEKFLLCYIEYSNSGNILLEKDKFDFINLYQQSMIQKK